MICSISTFIVFVANIDRSSYVVDQGTEKFLDKAGGKILYEHYAEVKNPSAKNLDLYAK